MQADLFQNEDRLCDPNWLRRGFCDVRRNKGAAGIEGESVFEFEEHVEAELSQLANELKSGTYKPGGGVRLSGIPIVRDAQTTIGADNRSPVFGA